MEIRTLTVIGKIRNTQEPGPTYADGWGECGVVFLYDDQEFRIYKTYEEGDDLSDEAYLSFSALETIVMVERKAIYVEYSHPKGLVWLKRLGACLPREVLSADVMNRPEFAAYRDVIGFYRWLEDELWSGRTLVWAIGQTITIPSLPPLSFLPPSSTFSVRR